MRKIYTLEGLDCPHCSAEIEKSVSKLKSVNSASVNLMKQTLTIELADNYSGDILGDIEKAVHKHEPDVQITEQKKKKSSDSKPHSEHTHSDSCGCGEHHCSDGHSHEHSHDGEHKHENSTQSENIVRYKLKGLECPHCATEIEKSVCKIKGVRSATINLVNQTLKVELEDGFTKSITDDVKKAVYKHEPDVDVLKFKSKSHSSGKHHHSHSGNSEHHHHHSHSENSEHHHHSHHDEKIEHQHSHSESVKKEVQLSDSHSEDNDNEKDNENIVRYKLQGLDCPHCAAEIEKSVSKINGVQSASVNLVNQTLRVELFDGFTESITDDVKKAVYKHEPDVDVKKFRNKSHGSNGEHHHRKHRHSHKSKRKSGGFWKSDKGTLTRLIIGACIYAVGFAIPLIGRFNINLNFPIHGNNFTVPLYLLILIVAYIILGGDVLLKAFRNIFKGRIFDENFLMTVSTVGAFVIGEYPEAVAVMLFYQTGEFIQSLAVKKSRKSITDLMDIRPDTAHVYRNERIVTVSPEDVEIGETIVIRPGEKIPLDGVVTDGESMIDTMALTGESVPRKASIGDSVLSGCINENSVLTVEVTKEFDESTASKIIDLVENAAGRKAPSENFITTFSRYYTPIVVILAALLGIVPPLVLGGGWSEWIRRCFVFLVISCPCALVISIPLTFFGGIGAASKKGVLVKGSNYLEALSKVETIVFDKTGTLTKGVFKVTDVIPANGFTEKQLLAYGAAAECMSNHPIARSVVNANKTTFDKKLVKNYTEISGHGVSAEINGKKILAGNEKLLEKNNIRFEKSGKTGTKVYIAVGGKFAGCLVISDVVKRDSKKAISGIKKLGVRNTVMLTGDSKEIAKVVAEKLGIDEYYGELLPNEKVEKLEELDSEKTNGKKLAFVGDGINDAPVLARSDVGIAMGALGSDAAIEAADVVLMTDEPSKLIDAIKVAKYTKKIVMQNITVVIAVKILFLVLGAFGIAGMWEAVFGDVGIMILAVLNSMRILRK